jgi:hypothetical protein
MFNLGFPAEFKMYIDAICVVGKTFAYTPTGSVGLLKDQGRKCLHIHSSGGFHYGKDDDYSVPYLKSTMGFLGIEDFEAIVVEGLMPYRIVRRNLGALQLKKPATLRSGFERANSTPLAGGMRTLWKNRDHLIRNKTTNILT